MYEVFETKITEEKRFFESENYFHERIFFENGIVDDGYFCLQLDFSECELNNNLNHTEESTEVDFDLEKWMLE